MTLAATHPLARATGMPWRAVLARYAPAATGIVAVLALWWLAGALFEGYTRFAAFRGFAIGLDVPRLWAARCVRRCVAGDSAEPLARSARAGMGVFHRRTGRSRGRYFLLRRAHDAVAIPNSAHGEPARLDADRGSRLSDLGRRDRVSDSGAAAIWSIVFATAASVKRIDPLWLAMSRNLGGTLFGVFTAVIIPAVAQDMLTGLRLALGVAWIVLVPAEFLGVTRGLGYAINDARDTLSYDRLAALILLIGLIGYIFDAFIGVAINKTRWMPTA